MGAGKIHQAGDQQRKKLSFGFGSKNLFSSATTEIHRRDKIGLLGPNGSGKTTLLKIITGNLKGGGNQITKLESTWEGLDFPATMFLNQYTP